MKIPRTPSTPSSRAPDPTTPQGNNGDDDRVRNPGFGVPLPQVPNPAPPAPVPSPSPSPSPGGNTPVLPAPPAPLPQVPGGNLGGGSPQVPVVPAPTILPPGARSNDAVGPQMILEARQEATRRLGISKAPRALNLRSPIRVLGPTSTLNRRNTVSKVSSTPQSTRNRVIRVIGPSAIYRQANVPTQQP